MNSKPIFRVAKSSRYAKLVTYKIAAIVSVCLLLLPTERIHAQLNVKCGTPLIGALGKGKEPLFTRPIGWRDSLISPSGRFVIHFDASDIDTNNVTTHALARLAAEEADSAFDYEVTELGYPQPAFSANGHYDIYLVPKPFDAYGATFPLDGGDLGNSPAGIPRTRSFIEMDNRFTDVIYATKGYDALRITTFHEFFHLIQFADFGHNQTYSYFQEMSSVWMEMESTPQIPDFLNAVAEYLKHLESTFDATQNGGYGMGIYFAYLTNRFGRDIVKEIWQEYSIKTGEPISAIENVLTRHGSSFCQEYQRFGSELYYSGLFYHGRSQLPFAQLLPREAIVMHTLAINKRDTISLFPTSLSFFKSPGDSGCALVIARNTDPYVINGVISITGKGTYVAAFDTASAFCDTMVCPASAVTFASQVFPNPFIVSAASNASCYILAQKQAKPASTILNVYGLNMGGVFHSEATATPFNGSWNAVWTGRDDTGNLVESGEYLFDLLCDGVKTTGKILVVRDDTRSVR